ncbi:recombinase family protein [Rahnella sp. R3(2024)]|uniref:recombinase family protein n=1 Tax=Rahnella sp. R3(2024) TaxID=3163550 RepID=UPI0036E5BB7F
MAIKKVKAFLYPRISTLEQQAGFGIERQISTVMEFLTEAQLPASLGYQLDPENYEWLESDLGKSAYKGHNFTSGQLGLFKNKVVNGEITEGVLLIKNVDRFSRLPDYEAIAHFNALISRGIDVIEVESGQVFSTKIDGTLSKLSIAIEHSHQESKRKARLSTKNWAKMKKVALEENKALKNNCPMWLSIVDEQYVINNNIVDTINYMFVKFVEGYGGATLVRHLNDTGRLLNGKRWSTVSMYHTLRNRRLIGFIKDTLYYPVVVPM